MGDTQGSATRRWSIGLIALLGLVLAGCASDAELDTFQDKGETAREISNLAIPVFAVAGVILVLICGAVVYIGLRNRVKDYDDDEFPEQQHGHNALEIGWTMGPAAIMAVIAVFTIATHVTINETEANAIEIAVEGDSTMWEPKVVVVGQQWWWEFRYYLDQDISREDLGDARNLPPADIVTSGQMVIPVDEEVELLITSRDVIHSFWIPALNGKRDAAPNRVHDWKLSADDPGVYFGQCTEFCGLSHSRMRMQVVAMEDADFQTWIDEQMTAAPPPTDEAAVRGLEAFTTNCASCHRVDGVTPDVVVANQVSGVAPDLSHFASRTTFAGGLFHLYDGEGNLNRDDLEAWLRDPNAVKDNAATEEIPRGMPNLQLPERTIDDLVAYLATLGPLPSAEIIEQSQVD